MAETTTMSNLLDREDSLRASITEAERELVALSGERLHLALAADEERAAESKAALDIALAAQQARREALADAEDTLADLQSRAEAGDESVRGIDIAAAKEDVSLATSRLNRAIAEGDKARQRYREDASDNLLALLTYDYIIGTSLLPADAVLTVRTRPGKAIPARLPEVVISQQANTEGYAKGPYATGSVVVTVYGNSDNLPPLDTERLEGLLLDCEVQVYSHPAERLDSEHSRQQHKVEFTRAVWPWMPLHQPSPAPLERIAQKAIADVKAERYFTHPYNGQTDRGWTLFGEVIETVRFDYSEGISSGIVRFAFGTDRAEYTGWSRTDIVQKIGNALRSADWIGQPTAMGRITSVEIERTEGDPGQQVGVIFDVKVRAEYQPVEVTA